MPGIRPDVDRDGLLEYSVVFTDRSVNHMSRKFQTAICELSASLRQAYQADHLVLVPGGGTFGMEAVARQFATDRKCMIVRNGWFSYRWTQIFDAGDIPSQSHVLKARAVSQVEPSPFAPPPCEEVIDKMHEVGANLVFAPHVETSSGIMLPDSYISQLAEAAHSMGGLLILDCVASGAIWIDMRKLGVDVLITAPQKGWSSTPCTAAILLSARARKTMTQMPSTSFASDLAKWLQIMEMYENGGFGYHATMPTDSLLFFRDAVRETENFGLDNALQAQQTLGSRIRNLLEGHGFPSVAADGYQSPAVVVSYTSDPQIQNGSRFKDAGIQIAAGVPLQCDEPESFCSFRIGLFGLDKLTHIDRTVELFDAGLQQVMI